MRHGPNRGERKRLATAALCGLFALLPACDRGAAATTAPRPGAAPPAPDVAAPEPAGDPYRLPRDEMVRIQLAGRDVADPRVLAAMRKVPRHRFVPAELLAKAYGDYPLPIGREQTISQPYIVAFMSQALGLRGSERVLEIGTGSGYQAAVLAELCREVYSIEIIPGLSARAGRLLAELGYANVRLRVGDGYRGWPEQAPFDAILVTAAPTRVPQPLVDQLAVGGRMILPVGPDGWQSLVLVERTAAGVAQRELLPVSFVPMTGEAASRTSATRQRHAPRRAPAARPGARMRRRPWPTSARALARASRPANRSMRIRVPDSGAGAGARSADG
jgi:protein-L-isoaspartate(D-aspartate) O-methyltransferase